MYACARVCMYVCMYVCVFVCVCMCVYVCECLIVCDLETSTMIRPRSKLSFCATEKEIGRDIPKTCPLYKTYSFYMTFRKLCLLPSPRDCCHTDMALIIVLYILQ